MTTCQAPACENAVGQQDRSDYRDSRFCSVQCDVLYDKRKQEAQQAKRDAEQASRGEL